MDLSPSHQRKPWYSVHVAAAAAGANVIYLLPSFLRQDFHLDPESAAGASHSSDVSNDLTLEECLERFTEPESLSEGDSW